MEQIWQFFGQFDFIEVFSSFIVMFAIIDILGSIPIFLSLKEGGKPIKAMQACLTALGLFLAFFFAGDALLKLFGIDKASFAVAGSFVLFVLAVEMILRFEPNMQCSTSLSVCCSTLHSTIWSSACSTR